MKKTPPALLFLQDFCKKAQWRAKKLRERGSSTARPTEKGGGVSRLCRDSVAICGLPLGDSVAIRSISSISARRFGRFRRDLRTSSWRFGRFRRFRRVVSWRFGRFGRFRRVDSVDSVAICGLPLGDSCRHPSRHRRQDTKKPDSSIGESGSTIARRRALLTFC